MSWDSFLSETWDIRVRRLLGILWDKKKLQMFLTAFLFKINIYLQLSVKDNKKTKYVLYVDVRITLHTYLRKKGNL